MARFHKQSSPYKDTKTRDFYLDLWNPRILEPQDDDIFVVISPEHHERPDKLADQFYGTPHLYWVFWFRNKNILLDPIKDFTSGTRIIVPSKQYIQRAILS